MAPVERKYSRLAFDEPVEGPLDVKVFDGSGRLLRIIPGALLTRRHRDLREAPKVAHAETPRATVQQSRQAWRRAASTKKRSGGA